MKQSMRRSSGKKLPWEIVPGDYITSSDCDFISCYGDKHIRLQSFKYYQASIGMIAPGIMFFRALLHRTNEVVGIALATFSPPTAQGAPPWKYAVVVVRHQSRGQGIGSALFKKLLSRAEHCGAEPVTYVGKNNEPSLRMVGKFLHPESEVDGVVKFRRRR